MRTSVVLAVVAVIGLLLGTATAWRLNTPASDIRSAGASVGDLRPGFRHAGLDGQWVEADSFDGRALLVNFWATWCAPCRREMPLLQQASERHGERLAVVGVAFDEPLPVAEFVTEIGVSYPILVGADDVMATQAAWGNATGGLPYTVLVDRGGVIRWQHLGEVKADDLAEQLERWLPGNSSVD